MAVLDFDASKDLGDDVGRALADLSRGTVQESGAFILLDRENMVAILGEDDFALAMKCDDTQCLATFGRKLKAQKMLLGRISTLGKSITISVKITDVTTTKVDAFRTEVTQVEVGEIGNIIRNRTCEALRETLSQTQRK